MTTNFYFDMDGTLSIFDETISAAKPFNVLGSHYFQTVDPDETAIKLLKTITDICNPHLHILTRIWLEIDDPVLLEKVIDEHIEDKRIWCHKIIGAPYSYAYETLRQTSTKGDVLTNIPETDRHFHILIDDDPRILDDWTNRGGQGVQWLQPGRKMVTKWRNGPVLCPNMPFKHLVGTLLAIDPNRKSGPTDTI